VSVGIVQSITGSFKIVPSMESGDQAAAAGGIEKAAVVGQFPEAFKEYTGSYRNSYITSCSTQSGNYLKFVDQSDLFIFHCKYR